MEYRITFYQKYIYPFGGSVRYCLDTLDIINFLINGDMVVILCLILVHGVLTTRTLFLLPRRMLYAATLVILTREMSPYL